MLDARVKPAFGKQQTGVPWISQERKKRQLRALALAVFPLRHSVIYPGEKPK